MHFLFSTGKNIHPSRFMKFNMCYFTAGRRFFTLLLIIVVSGLWASEVAAQSALDARDLSTVRVEMISDEQLTVWLRRAEAEGYSIDEILMLASQRGLPASQQQLLRVRLQDLRMARPNLDATDDEVDDVSDGEEEPQSTRARQASTGDTDRREVRAERIEHIEERRVFGSRIFRERQTILNPGQQAAVPVTYTIGPGDELVVYLWGETVYNYRLTVTREGSVDIENLGPVFVSGLTLDQANERIVGVLSGIYSGLRPGSADQTVFARVSIGRLRTIQVSVAGEVHQPGSYALSSLSTVMNALYRSGGPHFRGTYRDIRVLRDNRVVASFDVYDFLIDGDQSGNIRLRDQDVIMVGPVRQRVDVIGQTRRTGLFELREGESLSDVLRFAGGFGDDAYRRNVRIHRNTATERRVELVQDTEFDTFAMAGGDLLFVSELLQRFENRVVVQGAVWREGEYPLHDGMLLSDLLRMADGVRPDAYLARVVIQRLGDDLTTEQLSVDLRRVLQAPGEHDIALKREDVVRIASVRDLQDSRVVIIEGAVRNPGVYEFRANMKLSDLILLANGFQDNATESRIEVSRRIIGEPLPERRDSRLAETFTLQVSKGLELDAEGSAFILQAYDRIFVYSRPEYAVQQTVYIGGEVMYPGIYAIRDRGERISSIIQRAGGLTDQAFMSGARLSRLIESIDRADVDYSFLGQRDSLALNLMDAEGLRGYRRIGIDLESLLSSPSGRENLLVLNGDILHVPQRMQTVRVAGRVMQEVEVRYRTGQNLRDYVSSAGGYTEDARRHYAHVIYPNGDVAGTKRYFFGLVRRYPPIEPGSEIIIPQKEEKSGLSTGELIAVSSTVVSMLATVTFLIDRVR
jgi:protein involved in polysaccharide export with SLBB domain